MFLSRRRWRGRRKRIKKKRERERVQSEGVRSESSRGSSRVDAERVFVMPGHRCVRVNIANRVVRFWCWLSVVVLVPIKLKPLANDAGAA